MIIIIMSVFFDETEYLAYLRRESQNVSELIQELSNINENEFSTEIQTKINELLPQLNYLNEEIRSIN